MNPKPTSQDQPVPHHDPTSFKVIPWVRALRDAMYEETQHMSPTDFAEYIKSRAAKVREALSS